MNKIIVASVIGLGLIASTLVATDAQGQRRGGVAVFHGPAGGTAVFRGGSAFHPYLRWWMAWWTLLLEWLRVGRTCHHRWSDPRRGTRCSVPVCTTSSGLLRCTTCLLSTARSSIQSVLGSPAWLPVLILGGTAVSSASAPSRRGQRAARVFEQQSGNRRTVFSVIQPARSGGPRPRCRHGGKPR